MSEELIIDLCYKLTENVYLPIREYIRKINMQLIELGKKTESYDFGTRIELFKAEIENGINKLIFEGPTFEEDLKTLKRVFPNGVINQMHVITGTLLNQALTFMNRLGLMSEFLKDKNEMAKLVVESNLRNYKGG